MKNPSGSIAPSINRHYTLILSMFIIAIGLFVTFELRACEIEFKVIGNKKDSYKVGDELVVNFTLTLTHRSCREGLEKTKIDLKNIKILGATKWTEVSSYTYQRKLKIKITGKTGSKATLSATRKCDKEGAFGSLSLKLE